MTTDIPFVFLEFCQVFGSSFNNVLSLMPIPIDTFLVFLGEVAQMPEPAAGLSQGYL